MAITRDAFTADNTYQSGGVRSFSHTVGAGSNSYLTVFVGYGNGFASPSIDSMTYNGVGMTLLITCDTDANTHWYRADLWGLVAPATGANTVTINFHDNNYSNTQGAVSYLGVAQTSSTGSVGKANGDDGVQAESITLSSATGEMIVSGITSETAVTTWTHDGGQTSVWTAAGTGSSVSSAGAEEAGASSVTLTWTPSNSPRFGQVAAALKPVAGGLVLHPHLVGARRFGRG